MLKIVFIFSLFFAPLAAQAACTFDNMDSSECSDLYHSIFDGNNQAPEGYDCMCQETSSSTSETVWVPNPSGDGGNYETVYTAGTTRSVPCPCY